MQAAMVMAAIGPVSLIGPPPRPHIPDAFIATTTSPNELPSTIEGASAACSRPLIAPAELALEPSYSARRRSGR
jgi:hypothetical protein